jgi:rod shape-determining protein MreC
LAFRDSPLSALKTPITWAAAVVAVLVGVIALALVFTDHRTKSEGAYGVARGEFDEALEPVSTVVAAPFHWIGDASDYLGGYIRAVHENRELKKQVLELQRWHDAAIALKNLDLRYESLLRLRTEPPIPMATARVVIDARGPFSDARLADAGSDAGVQVGNPAMSEDGVVGRVVGVTPAASRILLLTDVESRTPVLIDRTNARAILAGDGGPNPKLDFVRGLDAVKDGDVVLTSGDGGLYPRGLPVGVAARDSLGVWRVRLYSDQAAIDFVRILIFNGFSQKVDQAALAASAAALPPLTPEETQQLDAARAAAAKPVPTPSVTAPNAAPGSAAAAPAASASPSQPLVKVERSGEAPIARPVVKRPPRAPVPRPKIPKGAYHPGDAE